MAYFVVSAEFVCEAESQESAVSFVKAIVEAHESITGPEPFIIEVPHVVAGRLDQQQLKHPRTYIPPRR